MPKVVDAEQRRAELTEAAARVIARSGLEAATMREIAAEAGWTTGALTHYFTDKHELLLATFQASLAGRRSLRAPDGDDPRRRLRRTLEGALPADERRRRHWLVTLACASAAGGDIHLTHAQRDAYREFRDYVAGLVVEAGAADAGDAPRLAERLIGVVDGVAVQALFDPESWPGDRQLAAVDEALAMLDGTR